MATGNGHDIAVRFANSCEPPRTPSSFSFRLSWPLSTGAPLLLLAVILHDVRCLLAAEDLVPSLMHRVLHDPPCLASHYHPMGALESHNWVASTAINMPYTLAPLSALILYISSDWNVLLFLQICVLLPWYFSCMLSFKHDLLST